MNMRCRYILFLLILSASVFVKVQAQELHPVDKTSTVEFTVKNFGISTKGSFKGLEGTISYSPANPLQSRFDVSVGAATVETGIGKRDRHLQTDDYFDVTNFPRIRINSESIKSASQAGSYVMEAILQLRGTSKKVNIPFTVKAVENGYKFEGEFTINRLDYKVGSSSISLADQVTVNLIILAK